MPSIAFKPGSSSLHPPTLGRFLVSLYDRGVTRMNWPAVRGGTTAAAAACRGTLRSDRERVRGERERETVCTRVSPTFLESSQLELQSNFQSTQVNSRTYTFSLISKCTHGVMIYVVYPCHVPRGNDLRSVPPLAPFPLPVVGSRMMVGLVIP